MNLVNFKEDLTGLKESAEKLRTVEESRKVGKIRAMYCLIHQVLTDNFLTEDNIYIKELDVIRNSKWTSLDSELNRYIDILDSVLDYIEHYYCHSNDADYVQA